MGLFGKIFRSKKTYEEIITQCRTEVLRIYGLNNPTSEQLFNATLAIAIGLIGIVNQLGNGKLTSPIDEISRAANSLISNLILRPGDVAANKDELDLIIAGFPGSTNASIETIKTNGGALYPILFNSRGPDLVNKIVKNSGGMMGPAGYVAIVITEMVVGKENGSKGMTEVSMAVNATMNDLTELLR
jgi:hypothetical protein